MWQGSLPGTPTQLPWPSSNLAGAHPHLGLTLQAAVATVSLVTLAIELCSVGHIHPPQPFRPLPSCFHPSMHFGQASPNLLLPSRCLAGLGSCISFAPAAAVNLAPLAYRVVQHPHPSQCLPQWSVVHWGSSKLITVVQLLSGHTAQQVPLSHICRAARVKLQEGLQHNMRWVYQGEQRVFQSFCSWYQLQAFPAYEETLMVYVTYLDKHLKCYHPAPPCGDMLSTHSAGPAEPPSELPQVTPAAPHYQKAAATALAGLGPTRHYIDVPA